MNEFLKRRELNQTRQKKAELGQAKEILQEGMRSGFLSYFFQMNPFSDWMYGAAIFASMLKDMLDPIQATGIFLILLFVLTPCIAIFIGLMMLLGSFSTGVGRGKSKMLKQFLTLAGGTAVELIPGISILPVATLTAIWIYLIVLSSRKQKQPA